MQALATQLHSEWPKLYRVLAVLSAIGFSNYLLQKARFYLLIQVGLKGTKAAEFADSVEPNVCLLILLFNMILLEQNCFNLADAIFFLCFFGTLGVTNKLVEMNLLRASTLHAFFIPSISQMW